MTERLAAMSPAIEAVRAAVARLMIVEGVEAGDPRHPSVVFKGRLTLEPARAYDALAPAFQRESMTLLLRRQGAQDLVIGVPSLRSPGRPNPLVNVVLFALTLLSVGYSGLINGALYVQPGAASLEELRMGAPEALLLAAAFTVSFLGILLAHEFGHYLAARPHGTPVSLPYFIPFPSSPLGTMGAAIRLLAPPRNRRVLLDIGMARRQSGRTHV